MARKPKQFDWKAMQAVIDAGGGYNACHRRFGIAHATWIKALSRGDIVRDSVGKPYADATKRYDWGAIRAMYETGASFRACRAAFGFSVASWDKAVKAGKIVPRSGAYTLEQAMRSRTRSTVKRHLLKAGIIINRCDWCGLDEWRGKPLSIQIDHINGVRDDHRIENLRMLCPNCHSQTETFAAKNRSRSTGHSQLAKR